MVNRRVSNYNIYYGYVLVYFVYLFIYFFTTHPFTDNFLLIEFHILFDEEMMNDNNVVGEKC